MPLPSFSLARLLGLSALLLGGFLGCGGGDPQPPPPPPPPALPDASRSSVSVDRASGVQADGIDTVLITITVRDAPGNPLAGRTVRVEVSGEGNTVTQPVGVTPISGVVTALVVSTQVESKQVTASVEAEGGAVVLSDRPVIRFMEALPVQLAFLTASLSATAGEAIAPEVQVALQDRLGRTVPGALGRVTLALAAGPSSAVLEGTLTADAVDGIARFPQVVLKQAGTGYQLKATAGGSLAEATSRLFVVTPAQPSSLVLALPATLTAGSAASATVTIRDPFGNLATHYRGTVRFSSTSPGAVLPADAAFTAADNGSKSVSVTLSRAGSWAVRAEDVATPALAFQVAVSVLPAAAAQLVLTSPSGPFEAGEEFSVEVLARDAFGNDATGYLGTIRISSPDPLAELPADYAFTLADAGHHSFNVVLKTAANPQIITVTDTVLPVLTATLGREIIPGAPALLRFAAQPGDGQVRSTLPVTQVELTDAYGNRARVSSPSVSVSLQGGDPASVLSGTVQVSPVDGLASFADLSVDQEGNGFQLTAGAGDLPPVASASFNVIDDVPPGVVTLTSAGQTSTTVSLTWAAVGDDGNLGAAARYELRYATTPITQPAEFAAATLADEGTPGAPGSTASFTVTGLNAATEYHFAVRMWDSAENASALQDLQVSTSNPCEDVVCEVPEPTCAADGVTRVTFSSACVLEDNLPTCQDTEVRMLCPGAEGVCFAGECDTASSPQAGELSITEVMHSPSVGTTDYVELHNPTPRLLNIAGLQIGHAVPGSITSFTVSSPYPGGAVLVPPGGWFVVARHGQFDSNGGVPADYELGDTFELLGDGRLILRAGAETLVEDFTWSSSFPQTPGRSMNLASSIVGTWAAQRPWYWCDTSVNSRLLGGDYGTPGQPNEACGLVVGSAPSFCNIQFPKTFPDPIDPVTYPAVIPYGSRKTIYTQFSALDLTDRNRFGNDDYPHVQVQLGYGTGADPTGWQWSDARFNPFYDTASAAFDPLKDEQWSWLRIMTPGTYSYGFRYRLYDPVAGSFSGYTYCDQNGVAPEPSAGSYGAVTVSTEPLGPTQHVVISEFAPWGTNGGTGNEDDEFLELYNPSNAPVDLSGWKVQYMPAQGFTYQDLVALPAGASIAAHGFYLIAHTGYAGSVTPDLQYTPSLPRAGGHIRMGRETVGPDIRDSAVVDTLGWGSAFSPEGDAVPTPANAAGSLERKAALLSTAASMEGGPDATRGNGIDSDWNADDFVTRGVRDPQSSASPPEAP
jgi:chitodextrinase